MRSFSLMIAMAALLGLSAPVVADNHGGASDQAAQASEGAQAQASRFDISQTVVKMPIDSFLSVDEAVESMKLRANSKNMMFVRQESLPLSGQVESMTGEEQQLLEIFQFCDPLIAVKMVEYNPIFAAYMPCSIALVEEGDGSYAFMTLNLDMFIEGAELTPELKAMAEDVNNKLMNIMEAGATGAL